MKGLKGALVIAAVVIVAVVVGKNAIAKAAMVGGIKAITGLNTRIGGLSVGLLTTNVGIKKLQIQQPAGFPAGTMLDIPEVFVDYKLGAFMKGQVHLEEVRLHLHELQVVKNAEKNVNLNSIKALQPDKQQTVKQDTAPTPGKASEFRVDKLELRVDRVVYTDYTTTPPSEKVFTLNINQKYTGITNPYLLGSLVVSQALMQTTIAQLANFDVTALQSTAQTGLQQGAAQLGGAMNKSLDSAQKSLNTTTDAAKDAVSGATGAVKKLFGN